MDVVNADNQKVREFTLSPEVFGAKVNEHLLYEAVKQYRAGGRRGTHMTKNRALVSGSGKKPWRQKGTGRARVGETRNPLWRHGGTVFGPSPATTPTRCRRRRGPPPCAPRSPSARARGRSRWWKRFPVEAPKTKVLKGILDKLGVDGQDGARRARAHRRARALRAQHPRPEGGGDTHLTVYDVLDCRHLLVSQEALDKLEERLTP